jgi:hypothetical protein
MNLDENTTTILLQYIGNAQIEQNYRIMAAIQVKNTVKRAFGNHSYTNYDEYKKAEDEEVNSDLIINEGGKTIMQAQIVDLMMASCGKGEDKITNILLEIIGLMGRKYVQKEWPQLFPSLIQHLQNN